MRPGNLDSKRALALLNAVGREPTPTAVHAFDEFYYPLVVSFVRKRHRAIGLEVAAKTGATGSAAPLLSLRHVEEAAHVTALVALRRARASARGFDPALGSPTSWVLRAASFAYVEVAKRLARDDERLGDPDTEAEAQPAPPDISDPAVLVEQHAQLDDLFLVLGDDERRVVVLVLRYSYSYAEVAAVLFGDATATKRVDRLLQSARKKLAIRWAEMKHQDD